MEKHWGCASTNMARNCINIFFPKSNFITVLPFVEFVTNENCQAFLPFKQKLLLRGITFWNASFVYLSIYLYTAWRNE